MPPSRRADTIPAELLELYEPVETLGEGVTSVVFRARQRSLERPVVVKLLKLQNLDVAVFRARFEQEAKLLAQLEHPHVLRILDYGMVPGAAYMAYPDDRGVSLRHILREKGRLSPDETRTMLREVLDGLEHVHAKGVVHRDLKPANLLRREDGSWAILDLGLARALRDDKGITGTGIIVGTPLYMAPDQIRGLPPAPADDLYSLGVLAYESLAGKNPFLGDSLNEIFQNHANRAPPPVETVVEGVDAKLAGEIRRLMTKDRDERPLTAGESRDRLPDPALARSRRRKALHTGAPLGLVLGLGLLAFLLGRSSTTPLIPPAAPSPPATAPAVLPEGLLGRLRSEFDEKIERLPRDPKDWDRGVRSLPAARELIDWVRAGGEPYRLEEDALEALRSLDGSYRDMGFPRPFHPLLYPRPRGEPLFVQEREGRFRIPPFFEKRTTRGWTATAFERYLVTLDAYDDLLEDVGRIFDGEETGAEIPPRIFQLLETQEPFVGDVRRSTLSALLASLWRAGPVARRELADWAGEATAAFRELLYSVLRATEEEHGQHLSKWTQNWCGQLSGLFYQPAFLLSPETLLAFTPTNGEQHFVLGVVSARSLMPSRELGLDLQAGIRSMENHLGAALALDASPEELTQRYAGTMLELLDVGRDLGDPKLPLRVLEAHRGVLEAAPPSCRRAIAGAAWSQIHRERSEGSKNPFAAGFLVRELRRLIPEARSLKDP